MRDITQPSQLLHYAAAAQLEQVRAATAITNDQVAQYMKVDKGTFSRMLRDLSDPERLRQLDDIILTVVPELDRTGGLSSLAVRLRRMDIGIAASAMPAHRRRRMLKRPPVDELDVLAKASTLLFKIRRVPGLAKQVCERNAAELDDVVQRLILIGAAPPTPDNVDALILLGSLAGVTDFAFQVIEHSLERALANHPLGFRMWRAVTTIVRLNDANPYSVQSIKPWVQAQLEAAEERRERSLFPARSLDLELAIAIPPHWSEPGEENWADDVLRRRADNTRATVRERGTAAMGLWERAVRLGDDDHLVRTERYLRQLIKSYREEVDGGDALAGLGWVATALEQALNGGEAVPTGWSGGDEPCLGVVRSAVATLETGFLPPAILRSTQYLVEQALLQNAGQHRRNALDTLLAGGYTKPVINALNKALTHQQSEEWLRCRALFAISFLQDRERGTEQILNRACERAKYHFDWHLRQSNGVPRGVVSEMHAALFAIGDCFGAVGAEEPARRLRNRLNPQLEDLLEKSAADASLHRVARAAAYLVAVTAEGGDGTSRPLLERVVHHPDRATAELGEWALRRFEKDKVKPLHEMSLSV
ncbi:hypothetical protein ACIBXA_05135 [Micromonospora echinaurantiaca]|uniref:hypothetical protein n=1 Tax=Micromonospora echinaurantiaca TaxID=47857 RepID=UPI0037B1E90F